MTFWIDTLFRFQVMEVESIYLKKCKYELNIQKTVKYAT